jgi:hypothetical protein
MTYSGSMFHEFVNQVVFRDQTVIPLAAVD